eukprot:553566_1
MSEDTSLFVVHEITRIFLAKRHTESYGSDGDDVSVNAQKSNIGSEGGDVSNDAQVYNSAGSQTLKRQGITVKQSENGQAVDKTSANSLQTHLALRRRSTIRCIGVHPFLLKQNGLDLT